MFLNFCDKFLNFSYDFKMGLEDLHDSYFDIFVSRVWYISVFRPILLLVPL